MRQDAVMQQFFALINNVLQESPDTQKRKLRIVTYKVCCPCSLLFMHSYIHCSYNTQFPTLLIPNNISSRWCFASA